MFVLSTNAALRSKLLNPEQLRYLPHEDVDVRNSMSSLCQRGNTSMLLAMDGEIHASSE
jgi:hypothetical protein